MNRDLEGLPGTVPEVGAVYQLGDEDYRFGTGALLCRVTNVLRETVYDNEPWWEVEAMAKPPTSAFPAHERVVCVRGAILGAARRES